MMGTRKESDPGKPPGTAHSSISFGHSSAGGPGNPAVPTLTANTGAQSPHVTYQHIQDLASKRISTLDYLRKAWVKFLVTDQHADNPAVKMAESTGSTLSSFTRPTSSRCPTLIPKSSLDERLITSFLVFHFLRLPSCRPRIL
jgi:hypothetical protein